MLRALFFLMLVAPGLCAQPNLSAIHSGPSAHSLDDSDTTDMLAKTIVDGETREDSSYEWTWNTTDLNWEIDKRYLHHYSNDVLNDTTWVQRWNAGQWNQYLRYISTYDGNNNQLVTIEQARSGSLWNNSYRYAYTYDSLEQVTSYTIDNWSGSAWVGLGRNLYAYDDAQHLVTQTYQTWVAVAWVNSVLRTNTYNTHGLIDYQLRQNWNSGWVDAFQYFYTYDTLQQLTLYLSEKKSGSSWVNNFRSEYSYDDLGNQILYKRLVPSGNFWVNDFQFNYAYDDYHNLILETEQDYQNSSWINVNQFGYGYDTNQNQVSVVTREWDTDWVNVDSSYAYFNLISAVPNLQDAAPLHVYPNPASDFILVHAGDQIYDEGVVRIYSSSGVMVYSQHYRGGDLVRIPVDQLIPGMYYVLMQGDLKRAVGTFIRHQ